MNEEFPTPTKPERNERFPTEFTTARGSVYRYLPDGRTQRSKMASGEVFEPQDIIVFIPPYGQVINKATELYPEIFKGIKNEVQFRQILLEYSQLSGRTIRIVNSEGVELTTPQELKETDRVFLNFIDKNNSNRNFFLPASKEPKIGYATYDTRKFTNEEGETLRVRHIGNDVIDIKYSE